VDYIGLSRGSVRVGGEFNLNADQSILSYFILDPTYDYICLSDYQYFFSVCFICCAFFISHTIVYMGVYQSIYGC